MKTFLLMIAAATLLVAQVPAVGGRGATTPAAAQQAQTVALQINADLATILETARLNLLGPDHKTPLYPDIPSLVKAMVSEQLKQVVRQFPPAALKAKRDAAAKAQADADAAEAAIVTAK